MSSYFKTYLDEYKSNQVIENMSILTNHDDKTADEEEKEGGGGADEDDGGESNVVPIIIENHHAETSPPPPVLRSILRKPIVKDVSSNVSDNVQQILIPINENDNDEKDSDYTEDEEEEQEQEKTNNANTVSREKKGRKVKTLNKIIAHLFFSLTSSSNSSRKVNLFKQYTIPRLFARINSKNRIRNMISRRILIRR